MFRVDLPLPQVTSKLSPNHC